MSLPPTGSDFYWIYREKGLTNLWKLRSAAAVMDGIYPEAGDNGFWLGDCPELSATHRSIEHPPGTVPSPSSRQSTLLGLHWSPLAGMTNPAESEVNKKGGKKEVSGEQAGGKAEEAVLSSWCWSKEDGPTFSTEPVLPAELPAAAKVQSLEYIFYASHFFDHILMDIHKGRDPESPHALRGLKGAPYADRDIWIETDIVIWRMCMSLADRHGLKGFRIFPTPHHTSLDRQRYTFDLNSRMSELGMIPPLIAGQLSWAPVHDSEVQPSHIVAFCGSCAKKLGKADKKACSGCRVAAYCSKECQKMDWQLLHKAECTALRAMAAAQDCWFCKLSEKKEQV